MPSSPGWTARFYSSIPRTEVMKTSTPTRPPERRDRLLREQVHDTYKQRGQFKSNRTRWPRMRRRLSQGPLELDGGGWRQCPAKRLCSACHRSADKYPAGEVTLERADLSRGTRTRFSISCAGSRPPRMKEHPMNRIIEIRESGRSATPHYYRHSLAPAHR